MADNYEIEGQLPRAETMANIPSILEQLPSNEDCSVILRTGTKPSPEEIIAYVHYNAEDLPNKESTTHGHADELHHNGENIAAPHTIRNKLNDIISTDPLHNIGEQTPVDKIVSITGNTTEQQLSQQVEYERTASTQDITAQVSEDAGIVPSHDTKEQSSNGQRDVIMRDTLEQLYDQESVTFRHAAKEQASKEQTNMQQSRTHKGHIQEAEPPATQSDDELQGLQSFETVSKYFARNLANTLSGENRSHRDPPAFFTTVQKESAPITNSIRKFSEVVDLTGNDSDVEVMEVDANRDGNGVGQTLAKPPALTKHKQAHYGGHPRPRTQIPNRISTSNSHNLIPHHPLLHQRTGQPTAPNPFNYLPNNPNELFGFTRNISERPDIVQPLDQAKARTRQEYNPDTIARDVLRAIGDNLGGPTLNGHLLGLKSSFRAVNNHSDLATFRWDLVEASVGMPPVYSQQDANHGRQIMPVDGPSRPGSGRGGSYPAAPEPSHHSFQRSYGAGGVTTYGGFLPNQTAYPPTSAPRPQQAYQGPYRNLNYERQLQTVQSLRTPSTAPPQIPSSWTSHSQITQPQQVRYSQEGWPSGRAPPPPAPKRFNDGLPREGMPTLGSLVQSQNPSMQGQANQNVPIPATFAQGDPRGEILQSRAPSPPQSNTYTQPGPAFPSPAFATNDYQERASYSSSPAPSSSAPKKTIGRPPGSKNLPKSTPTSNLAVVIIPGTPTPISKKPGRPAKNPASSHSNSPASTPLLKVPKKKGRPFRTPEAAAAAAKKAAEKAAGVVKKRGRPFGFKIKRQPDVPTPEGVYHPFLCEWSGCEAELQNLETLKKHVKVVHRKRNGNGKLECRWGKCGVEQEIKDAETGEMRMEVQGVEFHHKEMWMEHVEMHLLPVAWQMGDGPMGTDLSLKPKSTKEIPPHYLRDPLTNKLVTPWTKNQPIEGGRPKTNNAKRFRVRREGIHLVLEPIKNPKAYMKIDYDAEEDESASGDAGGGEESEEGDGGEDELAGAGGMGMGIGMGMGMGSEKGIMRTEIRARAAEEGRRSKVGGAEDAMELDG